MKRVTTLLPSALRWPCPGAGDQAVIKDRYNFSFYGGRTKETDHRSKVRSRVTANSLSELIAQCSQIFVMGHKNADLDAVGAAAGICCLCRKKGKKAQIVLDLEKNAAGKILEQLNAVPEYEEVFISGQMPCFRRTPRACWWWWTPIGQIRWSASRC